MKMTCESTAPVIKVAAWDRKSLFLMVANIFNRGKVKDKRQKEKDKSGRKRRKKEKGERRKEKVYL